MFLNSKTVIYWVTVSFLIFTQKKWLVLVRTASFFASRHKLWVACLRQFKQVPQINLLSENEKKITFFKITIVVFPVVKNPRIQGVIG